MTFGFDTAVQIATDALDRITTTAESHDRIMVVEVMGRTRGWIATYARIAGRRRGARARGAMRPRAGRLHSCAPGGGRALLGGGGRRGRRAPPAPRSRPVDVFGFERLGGVSALIDPAREMTGFEARARSWDIQRGGTPSAADRILGRASAWRPPTSSPPKVSVGWSAARHGDRRRAARGGVRDASRSAPTDPRRRARCRRSDLPARRDRIRRVPRQPISSASVGA